MFANACPEPSEPWVRLLPAGAHEYGEMLALRDSQHLIPLGIRRNNL